MRRADRLFQLVQLLRVRRFATADALGAELGVSKRTIYRDIRDLETSGVPIVGEAGVGYHLSRGYELPPLTFNADEIETLVVGLRVAQTWGDDGMAHAARAALTKIEAVLPAPLAEVLRATPMFATSFGHRQTGDAFTTFRRCIAERRKVRLVYTRRDGEESARVIRPLGLWYWFGFWSCGAWCELRGDYRVFRLDRIEDLAVTDDRFDEEPGIDLQSFMAHADRDRRG